MSDHRDRIEKIIGESIDRQASQQKEFYLFGKLFYVGLPFVGAIDTQNVIDEIEQKLPAMIFDEVDTIMVGDFDFLEDRELEAAYKDGAIYISNNLFSDDDLLENILHETAHSLENALGHFIYGDYRVMREFLGKREALQRVLSSHDYDISQVDFKNVEYSEDFDLFLYKEVGYAVLRNLTAGLFYTPYAATSLREYWASGFENYFLGTRENLKDVSPQLFSKIEGVITHEN